MQRKTIIIISAVLGILLVVLVAYYFLFSKNTPGEDGGIISGFKSFFPFGGDEVPVEPVGEQPVEPPTPTPITQNDFINKLRKISSEPVAGAGTLDVKAGTVVRYIEKATGHIYEVELFSPKRGRISNTTIPVVYDAIWGNKNNSLIARYLKDDDRTIDTYSLTVKDISTTTENTITGIAFPLNLEQVSVLGDSIFYLEKDDDSSTGYISNFDGSRKKQIWVSQIKGLLSQYVNTKTVALTTKPAPNINGYLYLVDTSTGQVKKALGDIPGLSTTVSNDASGVLYLKQTDRAQSFLFNIKSGVSVEMTPSTFPEKCVWSKKDVNVIFCAVPSEFLDGNSLTSWYMGLVSFTDDIWKYDLKNNTSSLIMGLKNKSNENIDVIKPLLSENEQYLLFMNKRDNSLWSLDLSISTSTQP